MNTPKILETVIGLVLITLCVAALAFETFEFWFRPEQARQRWINNMERSPFRHAAFAYVSKEAMLSTRWLWTRRIVYSLMLIMTLLVLATLIFEMADV